MNINEIKPQFYESIDYLSQEMARSHVDRNLNKLEKEIDEKLEKEEKEKKQKYRQKNKSSKKITLISSNENKLNLNNNENNKNNVFNSTSSFSSSDSNKKSFNSEKYEIFIEPIENEKEFFINKYSELFKKFNETKLKNENNEYVNEKEKKLFEIMNNLINENELNEENIKKLLNEKNKKISFYEKQTNKQKKFNNKIELIRKKKKNKCFN